MYGPRQISICRGGPAADSLRTLVLDVRILIVLDWYYLANFDLSGRPSSGGVMTPPTHLRDRAFGFLRKLAVLQRFLPLNFRTWSVGS